MKNLFTTFSLITILCMHVQAQNCGSNQFPIPLPDTVCSNDGITILYTVLLPGEEWFGDGVSMDPAAGHPIFDPSQVMAGTSALVTYGAPDQCGGFNLVTGSIFVKDCGTGCIPITMPITFPDTMCTMDGTIHLNGAFSAGTYSGDGVATYNDGGNYFDPSLIDANSTTSITYSAANSCQVWSTISTTMEIISCAPNCGTLTIDVPDVVCSNDKPYPIYTEGQITGDGIWHIWGGNNKATFFDPSAIQGSSGFTMLTLIGQDDCGATHTIVKTIDIDYNCDITALEDEILSSFSMSSNYVDNYSTITTTEVFESAELITVQGKIISTTASANEISIEVPTPGSYLVRFHVADQITVRRLLVK